MQCGKLQWRQGKRMRRVKTRAHAGALYAKALLVRVCIRRLQHIAGKVGQTRALAARQRDVATVRPALESVHHRCQAR